jgi:A/G-specific adenine glycosylase
MKNIEWHDSFFLSALSNTDDIKKKSDIFINMLWNFYEQYRRSFIWRENITPYHVFISEVMLQQTQVGRVEQKFNTFIKTFPTIQLLATASLHEVLAAWSGLGYNRRGRFLWQAAQTILYEYQGNVPQEPDRLVLLPGIGKNTAGSIVAFAYNKPTIFLETNIRAVLIHYFFAHRDKVDDKELLPLLAELVDQKRPRDFYYAMMDLGVWIKKNYKNPTQKSRSYTKQSPFEGSVRQVRGAILRTILAKKNISQQELFKTLTYEQELFDQAITELTKEKLIVSDNLLLSIP